jgi:hypothetical protein
MGREPAPAALDLTVVKYLVEQSIYPTQIIICHLLCIQKPTWPTCWTCWYRMSSLCCPCLCQVYTGSWSDVYWFFLLLGGIHLAPSWPAVGPRLALLAPGWPLLAPGWPPSGPWLACSGPPAGSFGPWLAPAGPWLASIWPLAGLQKAPGWPLFGPWLASGWPPAGLHLVFIWFNFKNGYLVSNAIACFNNK